MNIYTARTHVNGSENRRKEAGVVPNSMGEMARFSKCTERYASKCSTLPTLLETRYFAS